MATCGGAAAAPAPTNFVPDEIWHRAISLAPGELVHLHLRSGDDARKFQESCPLLQHAPPVTGKNFCDAQARSPSPRHCTRQPPINLGFFKNTHTHNNLMLL